MKYSKLVRDKIPDIIRKKGEEAVAHVAEDAEYWQKLKEKLLEECQEFIADETPGEIADILEVIDALCLYKKFDSGDIQAIKKKKRDERGGFEGKVILDEA